MKTKTADKVNLCVSIIAFLLLAVSFLLMPLDVYNKNIESSTINIVAGLCFWIALVAGIASQFILTTKRKRWCSIYNIHNYINKKSHVGAISFFQNKYAVVTDVVMLISITGCVVSFVATKSTGYICYVFIALAVFSFCLHCILNGRNFFYVTNQGRLLSSLESNYKKSK